MARHILAIDQGTTSTKAVVLDDSGRIVGRSRGDRRLEPSCPRRGWVEYDPGAILASLRDAARSAIAEAGLDPGHIAAVGLANQGETVIAFDADSGEPIGPAISWQDRRSADLVERWRGDGLAQEVVARTGLRLDAYFAAPKLAWLMANVPEARRLQARGRLRAGTSDAWLVHELTGRRHFVTDAATASRTMLMDLRGLSWSAELAGAFGLDTGMLPAIVPNAAPVGAGTVDALGCAAPIAGLCVDQQAALFGHRAHRPGRAKATYGTGCFVLTHIGANPARRVAGLLTCVAWQLADRVEHALDGGVYCAGALLDWLVRLGLADDVAGLLRMAGEVPDTGGAAMVPALGGLAAPHWSDGARACWVGMSAATERRHLLRAAVESIAFRVRDIVDAIRAGGDPVAQLHVDGGLTRSDLLMQLQADVLGVPVQRSPTHDLTAVGVGLLAGLGIGLWPNVEALPAEEGTGDRFTPRADNETRAGERYRWWRRVCEEVVRWGDSGRTL